MSQVMCVVNTLVKMGWSQSVIFVKYGLILSKVNLNIFGKFEDYNLLIPDSHIHKEFDIGRHHMMKLY